MNTERANSQCKTLSLFRCCPLLCRKVPPIDTSFLAKQVSHFQLVSPANSNIWSNLWQKNLEANVVCVQISLFQPKCMMKHASITRERITLGNTKTLCTDTSHVFYHLPTAPRYILILMCLPHGLLRLKNHLGFQLQRIK